VQVGPYPSYSLMYHGRNDRPIREAYARLFAPCFPQPRIDYATTGNNRIGFVVTKSHEDLFVRSMGGVLRHIDTSRFEITVICSASREKYVRELVNCARIRVLPAPEQIAAMAETLKRVISEDKIVVGPWYVLADEFLGPEDDPAKGTAEVILAKQRNGPTGVIPLTFLGTYTRFENPA